MGRGSPGGGYAGSSWSGGPSSPDAFGAKRQPSPWQLVEAYKSIIYFCVNLNAVAVTRIPLRLYAVQRPGDPEPKAAKRCLSADEARRFLRASSLSGVMAGARRVHELAEHPFLDTLDRPNPYFDRRQLLGLMCRYLDVVGVGYIRPVAGPFGPPSELWPLQSQYVYPVPFAQSALIEKYRYFTDEFPFDGLIRMRWESLKNPFGACFSPTQAAIEYAGLEDKFVAIQDQLLGLGPRPAAVVSPIDAKMPIGDIDKKLLEQDLNRKHGPGNQGRFWVSKTPLNVSILDYKPADVGTKEISEYDLMRTANCFGTPISYFTSDTNLANLQASHRQHAELAVEPRCDLIASALTSYVQRFDRRLFLAFDPCLGEDEEQDAKVREIKLRNAVLLPNEWRGMDGLEPIESGDVPLVLGTLATLESKVNPAPVPAAPAPASAKPDKPTAEQDDEEDDADAPEEQADETPDNPQRSAIDARIHSLLDKLDAQLLATPVGRGIGRDHRGGDPADGPVREGGRPRRAAPAAGWEADQGGAPGVVPATAERGPGSDPALRDRPADELPEPHQLRRSDGAGDDAPDLGLLARVGDEDGGTPEGVDGPGPRGMDGDEPAHQGGDPEGEPGVLFGDERDDGAEAGGRPGQAPE
jgi:hypothetical protein